MLAVSHRSFSVHSPCPSAHCTFDRRITTVDRIAGDHLPSSAPPNGESSLSSGDRLRLMPRGLVFGAATVDDGGMTRTPHINVSHEFVVRGGDLTRVDWSREGESHLRTHSRGGGWNVPLRPRGEWGRGSNYPECSTLLD